MRPTTETVVDPEWTEQFWADGFATITTLIDAAEVQRLRSAYDEIISGAIDAPTDRNLGGITRQVMVPSMVHDAFDDNAALAAGRTAMRALFPNAVAFSRTYDMLIDKPAGHPHETPWHQDAGYYSMPVAAAGLRVPLVSIQFWVALDDVDVDNGCMQFVPGAHLGELAEHRVVSGHPEDEGRLIGYARTSDARPERAVACPLSAGGATMHTAMTPHYTGPNVTTDRRRRAYIFNLAAGDHESSTLELQLRQQYVRNIADSIDRGIARRPRDAS
jgi:ectoine hydroxylase-related dioxygenase (phytanoyl-CoA dioxygenase family)